MLLLHPDKVERKNPDWVMAASYFYERIEKMESEIQVGYEHYQAVDTGECDVCEIKGACNKGKIKEPGYTKGWDTHMLNLLVSSVIKPEDRLAKVEDDTE